MKRAERGQATVLVIGLTVLCFAVAGVAVDGTRAFIYRRTLQNVADSAARTGASELDARVYYRSGGESVVVDAHRARVAVARYLDLRAVPVSADLDIDGGGVQIILRGTVKTSFLGLIGIGELPVAVEARAEPLAGE